MYTIIGANGFIGRAVQDVLRAQGLSYDAWGRQQLSEAIEKQERVEHGIYCVGLTSDFRERASDTFEAHVGLLQRLLRACNFQSFLYLSSTRVYAGADLGSEDSRLRVNPNERSDLYNISKLAGESLVLAFPNPTYRVARLSNVYGDDFNSQNFINAICKELAVNRQLVIRQSESTAKDYISLDRCARLICAISREGQRRIYNVASGVQVSHQTIAKCLARVSGSIVEFSNDEFPDLFPTIDVSRIQSEWPHEPDNIIDALPRLYESTKRKLAQ